VYLPPAKKFRMLIIIQDKRSTENRKKRNAVCGFIYDSDLDFLRGMGNYD